MRNALNIEIPDQINGLGSLKPFAGASFLGGGDKKSAIPISQRQQSSTKLLKDLREAIERTGLKDGMTISFHHHFRNGDFIVNMVVDEIAKMGIKDLVLAASSLQEIHAPLIEHIKNGVIKRIETSGLRGKLADAVSTGLMDIPIVFRSHGDRARAVISREIAIDVAFLGVPAIDAYGNASGYSREGNDESICGSLGYAKVDAQNAKQVVAITSQIVSFPNAPCSIPESEIDYIVKVDAIGDPKGIMSGATRFTTNPRELLIAKQTADIIAISGYFEDGFSLQTGTGGASLATTRFLREKMLEKNITASFALGGITGAMVKLHEEGLIKRLLDVQDFDLTAAESLKKNPFHWEIDSSIYANILNEGCAVNQLDVVVLSALEIDVDYNVNVLTGSDGVIRGAIGGHPDTAAGASVSIVVAPLLRGRMPMVLDRVNTIVTPGNSVDILVTDQGVAVNPRREDLMKRLSDGGIPLTDIKALKEKAEQLTGVPEKIKFKDKIVGVVTYRDGTIIDVIKEVE